MLDIHEDILTQILYKLVPSDIYTVLFVSKSLSNIAQQKVIQSKDYWEQHLKSEKKPLFLKGSKAVFFQTPEFRCENLIDFDVVGKKYLQCRNELIDIIKNKSCKSKNAFDGVPIKKTLLEYIRKKQQDKFIYIQVLLYHNNEERFEKIMGNDLLCQLIEIDAKAIELILKHPDNNILQHIDDSLLIKMIKKDKTCIPLILEMPDLYSNIKSAVKREIIKADPQYNNNSLEKILTNKNITSTFKNHC